MMNQMPLDLTGVDDASVYLKEHRIPQLIQAFVYCIMKRNNVQVLTDQLIFHKPVDTAQFLIDELRKLKEGKATPVKPLLLFTKLMMLSYFKPMILKGSLPLLMSQAKERLQRHSTVKQCLILGYQNLLKMFLQLLI